MALESDQILDRHRLKRRLTFWRISAIIAAALLIVFAVGKFSGYGGGDYIATFEIQNIIVDDADRNEAQGVDTGTPTVGSRLLGGELAVGSM